METLQNTKVCSCCGRLNARQKEFLKVYKTAPNLAEAKRLMHVSGELLAKWKAEKEYRMEHDRIAHMKMCNRVTEKEWQDRIANFLEYVKMMTVPDALKRSKIGTQKFVELRRNDKDFMQMYDKVRRAVGFNTIRQKRQTENDETNTRVCIDCGRELPLSVFFEYKDRTRVYYKRCVTCLAEHRRKNEEKLRVVETDEIRKLRAKVRLYETLMRDKANVGDTQGYIDARREYDYYKNRLEFATQQKTRYDGVEYHINLTNK